jgi:inosine/xanthosine triphosphate pyrophosphatase family protein
MHLIPLVIATRNSGKSAEIRDLLTDFSVQVKNLADFGPIAEVEEDGRTFDDNAYKKASFAAGVLGIPALADDSGLVVEAWSWKRWAARRAYFRHDMPAKMPPMNNAIGNCSQK